MCGLKVLVSVICAKKKGERKCFELIKFPRDTHLKWRARKTHYALLSIGYVNANGYGTNPERWSKLIHIQRTTLDKERTKKLFEKHAVVCINLEKYLCLFQALWSGNVNFYYSVISVPYGSRETSSDSTTLKLATR